LNPYLFEMANIRDQDSWVHMHEPEKATEKAKDLVRMAVAKAQFLQPLKPGQLSVNKATMIIGGGLAGITAALSLAEQGFESYIVEKTPYLGGNYRELYYTLEGLDTKRHLAGLLERVKASKLIHVFTDAEIVKIEGFIGNYKTTIKTRDGEEQFEHGVVVVATGAYELETSEYLHGQSPNVTTQRNLEKMIAERDGRAVQASNIVMIQCVGSRTPERPYCSRYCCSEAMKNALKLKEMDPNKDVTIIYRDIRTFGLKEDYYKKARELNVKFIRYDEDRKPEISQKGDRVVVRAFDPILNASVDLPADLLALSVGTVPNPENAAIGQMLKVPTNQDGFFLEAHVKLRPVDFATDGVFMCGMAHAPKLSEDTIVQANAAVSRACTVLTKDFIEAEGKTAYVIKERCSGCGLCEQNCPFGAIAVNPVEGVAEVNTVLCKGCGVCTASCRMNAVDLNGFTNEEVVAQIVAL
jgi:heterodisulfide reductase subunit A